MSESSKSGSSHHERSSTSGSQGASQSTKSSRPRKGKTKTSTAENAQKKMEMEEKIRRRVALEEKAFRLVEQLLENPISEEFLIESGQYITPEHYKDVVEERSISSVCGYPVCAKLLKNVPKQKYHISVASNKVYDISDRKKFCSNQCYKASTYYQKQISTTPLWMRDVDPPLPITLLELSQNRGSIGQAVISSPDAEVKKELKALDMIDKTRNPSKGKKYSNDSESQKPDLPTSSEVDQSAPLSCEGHKIGMVHQKAGPKVQSDDCKLGTSDCDRENVDGSSEQIYIPSISEGIAQLDLDQESQSEEESGVMLTGDIANLLARVAINKSEQYSEDEVLKDENNEKSNMDSQTLPLHENRHSEQGKSDSESHGTHGTNQESQVSLMDNVELFSVRSEAVSRLGEVSQEDTIRLTERSDSSTGDCKEASKEGVSANNIKTKLPPKPTFDSTQTVRDATNQKAQLLMELLDKREALNRKLNDSKSAVVNAQDLDVDNSYTVSPETESKSKESQHMHDDCIDDYSGASTKMREDSSTTGDSSGEAKLSKFSKADVLANIQRLQEQKPYIPTSQKTKGLTGASQRTQKGMKKTKLTALDLMRHTLLEWKTDETVKFLNRGKSTGSTGRFEEQYAELCRRVDKQDISNMLDEETTEEAAGQGKLPSMQQLQQDASSYEYKVREFYNLSSHDAVDSNSGTVSPPKEDKTKSKIKEESCKDQTVLLPPVDTYSQVAHRRKIVLGKLSRVFPELLGPLKLSVADVSGELKQLIKTFNLTSTNILLKPAEWTLMAYFLLKLLSVVCSPLHHSLAQDTVTLYFRTMLLSLNIAESEVNEVIHDVCMDIDAN